jgi:GST-like protein
MADGYILYGAKGGGSMIVEAALTIAGASFTCVDLDWSEVGWDSAPLKALNPLGQVPTLVMPDRQVMTESAAMILHLDDIAPAAGLVPPQGHPGRPAFQRWLIFLVSAVYPTFTYGDDPKRWVGGDEAAGAKLRTGTDEHRKLLWRYLEGQTQGPWLLGDTWSALDLYMPPMAYWRPGRAWFEAECPRLYAIARAMEQHDVYGAILRRHELAGGGATPPG